MSKTLIPVSVVVVGLLAFAGCEKASPDATTTEQDALITNRVVGGGITGFHFLPPLGWAVPPAFDGVFVADLAPDVRIDRIDAKTDQIVANVTTLTAAAHQVRRQPRREFYIARFDTGPAHLSASDSYRVTVLVDGKALGAVDLAVVASWDDLGKVDNQRFVPVINGIILSIKFRIERQTADQDGDGVPDWRDNCPTVYNPPTPKQPDPWPTAPTPPHCFYDRSACDPQEVDCLPPASGKQLDSDGDGIGDACECANSHCSAGDACNQTGACDPKTGACTSTPVADGTSCSDGNACNGAETCQSGVCTAGAAPTCAAGSNPCMAPSCDPVNGCGSEPVADGTACPLTNATGTCSAGICGSPTCAAGFGDCDGDPSNGCELNVTADVNNCGACGVACKLSCEPVLFSENWQSGSGAWRTSDGNPIVLASDGTACNTFQRETESAEGGRVFTIAGIPANAGSPYCLAAWIRGSSDSVPFLGIQVSDAAGDLTGNEHWLIGQEGYETGYSGDDVVATVITDGTWHWEAKAFTFDAGASDLVIKDENFATGTADFDVIQLFSGACPAEPISVCVAASPTCTGATCTAGVCGS